MGASTRSNDIEVKQDLTLRRNSVIYANRFLVDYYESFISRNIYTYTCIGKYTYATYLYKILNFVEPKL